MVEMNEKLEGLTNKIESLSKETACIKKQMEVLELKNITTNKKLKR